MAKTKYKCLEDCDVAGIGVKKGVIREFDEPMNPKVWEPLEGDTITNAEYVEYCRKKHAGELEEDDDDVENESKLYSIRKNGKRYEVIKIEDNSVVKGELLKKEAQKLVAELLASSDAENSSGEE